MRATKFLAATLALAVSFSLFAQKKTEPAKASVPRVEIPYKQYTLSNGLTLIVHEDHKAPIAAVNIWYHVGSKNEKPGKTGFAHLFEHLMFNGSEHFNTDYFKALESIGDRKSTRLNSSHSQISYAVFCSKKKTQPTPTPPT